MKTKIYKDEAYMEMAYSLAENAKGWTSPNPYVGAVIVKNSTIVGSGYHEKPGSPHAEILAIKKAGTKSFGATAYITLEPCIHWGRTPPCINSILKAGLKRIVISALDPNPLVYKKGLKKLKDAGILVSVGLLEEKNTRLNETYLKYITHKIPFVMVKAALSLDGKIATRTFDSQWISSEATREYIHLLRGEYDAVMVGINTILKDDPRLTIRHPNWKNKTITRIILDSKLRFPLDAKILNTLSNGKILIFTLENVPANKKRKLEKKGVEIISLPPAFSYLELQEVLKILGKREISSVMIEGGGTLFTEFIEKKLADKIIVSISAKLIGGKDSPEFFQGDGVDLIKNALQLKNNHYFQIDDDILWEGYF